MGLYNPRIVIVGGALKRKDPAGAGSCMAG